MVPLGCLKLHEQVGLVSSRVQSCFILRERAVGCSQHTASGFLEKPLSFSTHGKQRQARTPTSLAQMDELVPKDSIYTQFASFETEKRKI